MPVIWVQHSSDELAEGSDEWGYVAELQREDSEPLVHKRYGDSFEGTDLESELAQRGVGRLVITGAQTDACIRSTLHSRHSPAATTPSSSATPTPPRTSPSGARHRPTRSSPTPTCIGRGSRRPVATAGVVDTADVTFEAPVEQAAT